MLKAAALAFAFRILEMAESFTYYCLSRYWQVGSSGKSITIDRIIGTPVSCDLMAYESDGCQSATCESLSALPCRLT